MSSDQCGLVLGSACPCRRRLDMISILRAIMGKNQMRIIILVAAGLCMGGCATITRGTTQDFAVTSTPPGAAVKTSTGFECAATPCTFKMPRKNPFSVEIRLEGYQTETVLVESKVAGSGAAGMAGNVLVGGLIGIGVDASSGATKDLTPNPVAVTLTPNGQPRPASTTPASTPPPTS
jgi:hypothetical protein